MNTTQLVGGTTLRNPLYKENNNMALHVGGNLSDIIENRKALSEELNIDLSQWTFSQQTHSDHIHEVTAEDTGKGSLIYEEGIPDCDALYTKEKNLAIGVFHADCVPILLYDPFTKIIMAIHSGWQGTMKEITRKALQHLIDKEHVDPKHVRAYIGPSIAYRSFEVGDEVIEKVVAMSFDTSSYITYKKDGKALVDNKGLNKAMLLMLGVKEKHITMNRNDTFTQNESLFSYRRDPKCGRHLSFLMMKEEV